MLIKALGIPWILFADFNIVYEEFLESDWPSYFEADPLHPNTVTTTSLSKDRAIDFAVVSKKIKVLHHKTSPIFSVPWYPHYGILYEFEFDVNKVCGDVVCIPKALPMGQFGMIWGTISQEYKDMLNKTAHNRAKKILQKQKRKTGVAILGKPNDALKQDPKFQGSLGKKCIQTGEQLALASLSAELLVLDTCQFPKNKQSQYTG